MDVSKHQRISILQKNEIQIKCTGTTLLLNVLYFTFNLWNPVMSKNSFLKV